MLLGKEQIELIQSVVDESQELPIVNDYCDVIHKLGLLTQLLLNERVELIAALKSRVH